MAIAVYYTLPRAGVAQAVLLTLLNATAAGVALRTAAVATGAPRVVWTALGSAMTLCTLANGPYYAYPLITGHPVPFPCPVDALWLLTYPCFALALHALSKERRRGDRRGDALDAMLVTVGGATLIGAFIAQPILNAAGMPLLAHIVSIAYPAMDLAVFAILARLMVSGGGRNGAMRPLLLSFVALLVSDLVYHVGVEQGTYAVGGATDGLWMASYLLIGVAALHPGARGFRRSVASASRVTNARLAFLCVSALAGPVLMAVQPKHAVFLAGASGVSFLLVMSRLTMLNRAMEGMSREMERRATTDSLTGLANRANLYVHVEAAIARRDARIGMLLVDLDEFKAVNDVAGHSAGDAVLIEMASRLRTAVRASDVVARIGGDEFAILVDDASEAQWLAERVIAVLARPVVVGDREFALGASVGVVTAGSDMSLEKLVRNADIAMYAAKRAGKGRVVTFDNSMYAEIIDRSDLTRELQDAVARGDIGVEYQPIVRLDTGATIGLEALARWTHAQHGEIPPSRFIPIAEQSGVILGLGRSVLRTALRDLVRFDAELGTQLDLSVNVSTRQLLEPGFCEEVAHVLAIAGVDPKRLMLEVTESAMIEEDGEAVKRLHALRALGVRICIDDFGTGYSSLAYLRRLPVERLKIDRAFIDVADKTIEEAAVARAILRIADTLGLQCIAEGVERKEQVGALRAAGCEFAQGFRFARPMPVEATIDYLKQARVATESRRGNVLVLGTGTPFLDGIQRRLRAAGFEPVSAGSLPEAYAVLRRTRIDLAVVDLSLPDEAMELCKMLRTGYTRGYVPVLAVPSEDTDAANRIVILQLGADTVLDASIELDELSATVSALMRAKTPSVLLQPPHRLPARWPRSGASANERKPSSA